MIYLAVLLSAVLLSIPAIRTLRRVQRAPIAGRRGMRRARNYGEKR
jgi:hypothetical protein